MKYYVLIEWVGGPDGKKFGSRSARWSRAKYFPVRPDLLQSISILPYNHYVKILEITVCSKNRLHTSDGRAWDYYKNDSLTKKIVLYFFMLEQVIQNSSEKKRLFFLFEFKSTITINVLANFLSYFK